MSRHRPWALLLPIALVGVGLCACARYAEEVQLTSGFAARDTEYGEALSRYTRKAELYQGVDTVAKAWATWKAPGFRRALTEASVRAYELEGKAAENLRREQEREARRGREFHVALYTPRKGWNDLEPPASLWRAFVELPGGVREAPLQVTRLPKSDKSVVEYPYVSPWTREYSLLFPVPTEGETRDRLTLILTGPLGTMRFEY